MTEPNLDKIEYFLNSYDFMEIGRPDVGDLRTTMQKVRDDLEALIANQVREARIDEDLIIADKLYDITTVTWGEPTVESIKEWGENHADLYVPTRDMHKVLEYRIAELKGDDK